MDEKTVWTLAYCFALHGLLSKMHDGYEDIQQHSKERAVEAADIAVKAFGKKFSDAGECKD